MSVVKARNTRVSLERGNNPLVYAQRLYTQFLQGLFNFCPVDCMHWEPDEDVTEIIIRAEAPLDLKNAGKRPAITVVLGPTQYQGLSIDNLLDANLTTDRQKRADLISGHLVAYCLAENDVIAQWISNVVVSGTMVNRRLLESPGGFHQIARPGCSANPPSPPGGLIQGDSRGLVMVQTNVPFTFQWTWETTPKQDAHLRSLDMVTSTRRASDFAYTPPSPLRRVQLAMSSLPVLVRPLDGTGSSIQVTDGVDGFQSVVADTSTDEA